MLYAHPTFALYGEDQVVGIAVPTRVWALAGGGILAYFLLRDVIRQAFTARREKKALI